MSTEPTAQRAQHTPVRADRSLGSAFAVTLEAAAISRDYALAAEKIYRRMSISDGLNRHLGMTLHESCLRATAPWARAVRGVSALLARLQSPAPVSHDGIQRVGQYLLGEKLGEGGMGVVYKGRRSGGARPVAIKLLRRGRASRENIRRLEREARLTQRLSHPNMIQVYDVGRTREGLPYFAMEYVDGLDLQTLVERDGPLAPERVAHLLAQLAGALSEVHAAGLIQGDVKPANVMLCRSHAGDTAGSKTGADDVVKLLDFGLSRALDEPLSEDSDDYAPIAGTPLYMPPEAITAPESVDTRSDLYSLGALGYFLLTGAPPFDGKTLVEVCSQHVHTPPLAPSARLGASVPWRLEALLLACLEKSPERRPQSAAELRAQLLSLALTSRPQAARRCTSALEMAA